jgi:mono/diheme cytochrome c family protein
MNSNRSPVSPFPNAQPEGRIPLARMLYAGLAVVAVVALGSTSRAAALQDKSTADSVYSDDQSKRGEGTSEGKCSVCHGEKLIGTDLAPGLQGDSFLSTWSGRTAGDLYEKIQTTMPADAPGSLNPQQATDLVAYIFKLNKFPSGAGELAKEQDALKAIKIRK